MITALLSVVIVLLLLILLLLVGVIRRLQAHEAVLSGSQTSMGDNSSVRPALSESRSRWAASLTPLVTRYCCV